VPTRDARLTNLEASEVTPVDTKETPSTREEKARWQRLQVKRSDANGEDSTITGELILTAEEAGEGNGNAIGVRPALCRTMKIIGKSLEAGIDVWEAARRARGKRGYLKAEARGIKPDHESKVTSKELEEYIYDPSMSHAAPTPLLQYAAALIQAATEQNARSIEASPRRPTATTSDLPRHRLMPDSGPAWEKACITGWRIKQLGGLKATKLAEDTLGKAHATLANTNQAAVDGSFVKRDDKGKLDQPAGVGSWCFVVGEHAKATGTDEGPALRCGEYGQQAIGPVSSSTFTETQGAATMLLVADGKVRRFWQDNQGSIAIIARMQAPLSMRSLLLKESSSGNSARARLGQRYQKEVHERSVTIEHVSGHDHRKDPPPGNSHEHAG
jgi:hypothetical protein